MPDHLHVLTAGRSDTSDARKCAEMFRRKSGYHFRRLVGVRLWQEGYFDRVLRNEESTREVVRYILENPVRAGLCLDLRAYPFSGSTYALG
jgi:putative transposase